MKYRHSFAFLASTLLLGGQAPAAPALIVTVKDIHDGQPIPAKYALCRLSKEGKSLSGQNIRPEIFWNHAPQNTKSYAVIVHDTDVPQDFTNAGKEGVVIESDAPRRDAFYHWALTDIPVEVNDIRSGRESTVIGFGKPASNDLGAYMPNPKNYGGPCPPSNDERIHHYHFTVYALDVPSLELSDDATAREAADAAKEHMIAKGEVVGTYTLNPTLRRQ